MTKKTKIIIAVFTVLILLLIAAGAFGLYLLKGGDYQQVMLKGYGISIPKSWSVDSADNALVFSEEGKEQGRFLLLYEDCDIAEVPALFGYTDANPVIRESTQYVTKVYELSFETCDGPLVQYVFVDLPQPPPYKAVLTLSQADKRTKSRILASVTLPTIGAFAPEKPIAPPEGEELENTVYSVRNAYGLFTYNMNRLEQCVQEKSPITPGEFLHVLSFANNENGRVLEKWYCLTADSSGTKYVFTYYQTPAGTYIYDNAPEVIREITKEISAEENYTRYLADGLLLLEGPYNQYAENKETLLQYKGTLVGDNGRVQQLVMEALPNGIVLENIGLQTENKPYRLTLQYTATSKDQYMQNGALNETAFYQNALMLLSLIENVDRIDMKISVGDKTFEQTYKRQTAEQQFENKDLREFTENEEEFTEFTEEIPKILPPDDTGSGNKTDGTRALKSATVIITPDMKIQHPETGKMVRVEPYANKYGLTRYFNKPINITLYEKVEAGVTTMWAAAVCEGIQIGTYPISTVTEFDRLVSLAG